MKLSTSFGRKVAGEGHWAIWDEVFSGWTGSSAWKMLMEHPKKEKFAYRNNKFNDTEECGLVVAIGFVFGKLWLTNELMRRGRKIHVDKNDWKWRSGENETTRRSMTVHEKECKWLFRTTGTGFLIYKLFYVKKPFSSNVRVSEVTTTALLSCTIIFPDRINAHKSFFAPVKYVKLMLMRDVIH